MFTPRTCMTLFNILFIVMRLRCFSARELHVRHPERIFHFFTFGIQPEQKFGVAFFRVLGWVFTVFSIIGVFMYLGLITYDLLNKFSLIRLASS